MLCLVMAAMLSADPSFALIGSTPAQPALSCFFLFNDDHIKVNTPEPVKAKLPPLTASLPPCTCGAGCDCGVAGCEGQNCPKKVAAVAPKAVPPQVVSQPVVIQQAPVQYYQSGGGRRFFFSRSACASGNCPN